MHRVLRRKCLRSTSDHHLNESDRPWVYNKLYKVSWFTVTLFQRRIFSNRFYHIWASRNWLEISPGITQALRLENVNDRQRTGWLVVSDHNRLLWDFCSGEPKKQFKCKEHENAFSTSWTPLRFFYLFFFFFVVVAYLGYLL